MSCSKLAGVLNGTKEGESRLHKQKLCVKISEEAAKGFSGCMVISHFHSQINVSTQRQQMRYRKRNIMFSFNWLESFKSILVLVMTNKIKCNDESEPMLS